MSWRGKLRVATILQLLVAPVIFWGLIHNSPLHVHQICQSQDLLWSFSMVISRSLDRSLSRPLSHSIDLWSIGRPSGLSVGRRSIVWSIGRSVGLLVHRSVNRSIRNKSTCPETNLFTLPLIIFGNTLTSQYTSFHSMYEEMLSALFNEGQHHARMTQWAIERTT